MSEEKHVVELIPAYALGCLDEEDAVSAAEHLARCSACRAELAAYQDVVDQMALAVPDAAPRGHLRRRLMRQVEPARSRPDWWRSLAGLFRRSAPAWGLAGLALVFLLAISNVLLWQRVNRPHQVGRMRVVALEATDDAPGATGTIVISTDGEYGTLVVDSLPALDAEHQYQLWLIRDDQRTSGGIFSVGPDGYAAMEILAPEDLSYYSAFGITIEPTGGSPGPTGDKVLGGDL